MVAVAGPASICGPFIKLRVIAWVVNELQFNAVLDAFKVSMTDPAAISAADGVYEFGVVILVGIVFVNTPFPELVHLNSSKLSAWIPKYTPGPVIGTAVPAQISKLEFTTVITGFLVMINWIESSASAGQGVFFSAFSFNITEPFALSKVPGL